MSVAEFVDLLSLDVTAGLVAAGARAPWRAGATDGDPQVYELDVLAASNTSPIVLTLAAGDLSAVDLRPGTILHVVCSGAVGNTAANKRDPVDLRYETWHARVEDATHLSLWDLDPSTGALVASVGNGTYTGGGKLSKALDGGRIHCGREYIAESMAAPRIVMVPTATPFDAPNPNSAWTAEAIAAGETDAEVDKAARYTARITYEVHVWGKAARGERSEASFAPTLALATQVLRSAYHRAMGRTESTGGDWFSQLEGAPQRVKYGQEFRFALTVDAPVYDPATLRASAATTIDLGLILTLG